MRMIDSHPLTDLDHVDVLLEKVTTHEAMTTVASTHVIPFKQTIDRSLEPKKWTHNLNLRATEKSL